jgi:hypothetical protein
MIKKAEFKKLDECPREYQRFTNLDEGESIFFARELEHVKSKTYDIKFPELKARALFPVEFEANEGAETITYEQYDQVGMAKIISNYADDLPRADVKGKEFTSKVRTIAASYGYNFDEIQAAKMAGKPLVQRKAMAAKRAHMVLENRIAFFGDTTHNLQGFLTNPNIQEVTLAADGTGSSKTFASKSAAQMIRDIASLFTAVHDISKGVEFADTLMLPLSQYNLIANTLVPDANGVSVMKWVLDNNPHLKDIVWVSELKQAGAGSTDKMVAYRKDPMALTMEVPSEFKQLPVQEKGLEFIVPTHHRFGGVLIYYPLSVAYADGI